MDDPQIGRFWQVVTLADKYVYSSTYAFSANKVTSHVELEGLEPYAAFRVEQDLRDVESGKVTTEQLSKRLNVRAKSDAVAVWLGLFLVGAVEELGAGTIGRAVRSFVSKVKGESENTSAIDVETTTSLSSDKSVRSSNKLQPDIENAGGDHSTYLRDANDDIFKYQEWKGNNKNPNKFDAGKRFDGGEHNGQPGLLHYNNKIGEEVPTPHINEKKYSREGTSSKTG